MKFLKFNLQQMLLVFLLFSLPANGQGNVYSGYNPLAKEARQEMEHDFYVLNDQINTIGKKYNGPVSDLVSMEPYEIEETLDEIGHVLLKSNRYLKKYTEAFTHHNKLISDYRKANSSFGKVKKYKSRCESRLGCNDDPFGDYIYDPKKFLDGYVERLNIKLHNGFLITYYDDLVLYINRFEKKFPELKRVVKEIQKEKTIVENFLIKYEPLYKRYLREWNIRRLIRDVTGYWKFPKNNTTIMVTSRRDDKMCYFDGIVSKDDGLKEFDKGDMIFSFYNPFEVSEPGFMKGDEMEWGRSKNNTDGKKGKKPRKQRIFIRIKGKKLFYAINKKENIAYNLKKTAALDGGGFQAFSMENSTMKKKPSLEELRVGDNNLYQEEVNPTFGQ